MQSYLLCGAARMRELVDAARARAARRERKARLRDRDRSIDALAPTNFLLGNPAALKRAFETGGASLARGARNFLDDVAHERRHAAAGRPSARSSSARTSRRRPGKVVFRNELIELIQYAPQTETVHEVPLLCSPPWINKYYVMDLAPERSFVEWAVQHGHTVFAISYRNPDASMRDVTLDDYLRDGPLAALDAVEEITGADEVNIVGALPRRHAHGDAARATSRAGGDIAFAPRRC